ncbi:hypothetical protein ACFP3I_04835 [Chryseobacterium arachidis]
MIKNYQPILLNYYNSPVSGIINDIINMHYFNFYKALNYYLLSVNGLKYG